MKTKTRLLFILIALFVHTNVAAQQADLCLTELIESKSWFQLEEEYVQFSEKAQNPMLKLFVGAMLDVYFNRPEEAISKIDLLKAQHLEELGQENYSNLIFLYARMQWQKGEYLSAVNELGSYLEEMSQKVDLESLPAHTSLYGLLSLFKDLPAPEIVRPEQDITLPIVVEDIGRGSVMTIEVVINDTPYHFYFDTGAGMSGISARLAKELNATILMDGISISGAAETTGSLATIDKLTVGDIEYRNPILVVFPPTAIDSIILFDAILGIDFINAVGETRIYPKEKKVVFPHQHTPIPSTGRNLLTKEDGQPYVGVLSDGERLMLHFDTGNVSYNLGYKYYTKHTDYVVEQGKKTNITVGGFGDIFEREVYRLPSFTFLIGNIPVTLKDMDVSVTDDSVIGADDEDGSLGYGFVRLFKELIINLNQMFVKVTP